MTEQDGKEHQGHDVESGDSQRESTPDETPRPSEPAYPEPPASWKPGQQPLNNQPNSRHPNTDLPDIGVVGKTVIKLTEQESMVFVSARKYITVSQVAALVSLFLGGVLLSTVAIVIAYLGYRKLAWIAENHKDQLEARNALKRSGLVAIGMGVLALVFNAVSLILFYPMLVDALQQGNLGNLLPNGQSTSSSSSPAPGAELFG